MTTQVLGILGDIANAISGAFSGIANWISDKIGQWLDYFMVVILKLVYEVLKVFYMLLDFIQLVFRKMAGLDTVYVDGNEVTGDLALMFFKNENVVNALIALTVTAFVMVFVTTFIAIIRNNYNARESKDNAIAPVVGKAFKALFSFIFVPLVCYFGVFVSNGLLKTVDEATRINGATTISGQVFAASAMNANRARIDTDFANKLANDSVLNFNGTFVDDNNSQYVNSKTAAEKIDDAFAVKLTANTTITASSDDYSFMFHQASPGYISNFDYMNTDLVFVYYDLLKFNWLFAFVSSFFIMAALLVAALGVIQRLFEIVLLFIISPPFIALMPLDDGKAYKEWAKHFIQSTVVMYGTVVALNIFFIVAPILQTIDLFGSAEEIATYGQLTCDLFNAIAHILFIMCGSLMIKDASNLITKLVTGSDKVPSLQDRGNAVKSSMKETYKNAKEGVGYAKGVTSGVKSKINSYYDPANVAKRQQAKAQKQQAKEDKKEAKAVRKSQIKALDAKSNANEITERDYIRGRRAIADEYRQSIGKKETLRTRARNVGGNVRTKLTGEPPREMSAEGKQMLQDVKDMGKQIRDDKDAYKTKRQSMGVIPRMNPKTKYREWRSGEKKQTLKAYKNSSHDTYKDLSSDPTAMGLSMQYALGNIDEKEYKKGMKEREKSRKNVFKNQKK